jgi:hypothetical protein
MGTIFYLSSPFGVILHNEYELCTLELLRANKELFGNSSLGLLEMIRMGLTSCGIKTYTVNRQYPSFLCEDR